MQVFVRGPQIDGGVGRVMTFETEGVVPSVPLLLDTPSPFSGLGSSETDGDRRTPPDRSTPVEGEGVCLDRPVDQIGRSRCRTSFVQGEPRGPVIGQVTPVGSLSPPLPLCPACGSDRVTPVGGPR